MLIKCDCGCVPIVVVEHVASDTSFQRTSTTHFQRPAASTMDILHNQLNNIQRHLAFVATDPINWKLYVQVFSWTVTLFESYLLCAVFSVFSSILLIYFLVQAEAVSSLLQEGASCGPSKPFWSGGVRKVPKLWQRQSQICALLRPVQAGSGF